MKKKIFFCGWGEGFEESFTVAEKPEEYFCEENGYFDEDIESIKKLRVGEFYLPVDIKATHCIIRKS